MQGKISMFSTCSRGMRPSVVRQWLLVPATALLLAASAGARAQAYVNVTVGGAFAPGVYGQISMGNNPPPPVINAAPVIVGQPVYGAPVMYLYVRPKEYRDWGRYCWRYNACGRPVRFVRVDERNRWWEKHRDHPRGHGHYRQLERWDERPGRPEGDRGYDFRDHRDERRHGHQDHRDEGHHGRGHH